MTNEQRPYYTQEERIMQEQRKLQDAELIEGGARYDEHLRLVITQNQLERAQHINNALGRVTMANMPRELPPGGSSRSALAALRQFPL
jgi:hypothetical protein